MLLVQWLDAANTGRFREDQHVSHITVNHMNMCVSILPVVGASSSSSSSYFIEDVS